MAVQEFADACGWRLSVGHVPPSTRKWHKIEHRLFCYITENWRGKLLVSRAVMVHLIGNTITRTGVAIPAALGEHTYPAGINVSAEALAVIHLKPATCHGDGNDTTRPRASPGLGNVTLERLF